MYKAGQRSVVEWLRNKLEKLVEDLETKFPHQPIHPKEQLPSIMYRAGQESVVQYVKQILNEK